MASLVTPSSWKSTDDAMCLQTLRDSQVIRYLEQNIVLTRNEAGRGGVSAQAFGMALFFLQSLVLVAHESRCMVFAVPCGCQGGTYFNIRSQGSRTWGSQVKYLVAEQWLWDQQYYAMGKHTIQLESSEGSLWRSVFQHCASRLSSISVTDEVRNRTLVKGTTITLGRMLCT